MISNTNNQWDCHPKWKIRNILGQKPIKGGNPAKAARVRRINVIYFSTCPVLYKSVRYVRKFTLK